jgi:hypothetical protein
MRRTLRLQYLLWAHHSKALSRDHDGMSTVGDVLRTSYRIRHDQAVAGWKHLLVLTGRTFIEPFDMDRIAVALTGLFEGLLARQQVDPDAVDDTLFADMYAAFDTLDVDARGGLALGELDVRANVEWMRRATDGVDLSATGAVFDRRNRTETLALGAELEAPLLGGEARGVLRASSWADAFLYDSLSVFRNQRRHPDTTRAILRPFREETWAIGLRPGDDELRRQINEFLQAFRAAGGFERLGDEFLPEEKRAFKEQGLPFYF